MSDEAGETIESAGPSMPAVVLGLSGAPDAGDDNVVVADERKARELAEYRQARSRDRSSGGGATRAERDAPPLGRTSRWVSQWLHRTTADSAPPTDVASTCPHTGQR